MATLDEDIEELLTTILAVDDRVGDSPAWKGAADANVDVPVFGPPCKHLQTAFV